MRRSISSGSRTVLQLCAGLVLSAIFMVFLSQPAHARVLEPMQTQKLVPGALLRYPIVWRAETGRRVEIQLGAAPEDARLVVNGRGNLFVVWPTTPQMPAETLIEIVAKDIDSGEKIDTRHLLVRAFDGRPASPVATRPAFTFNNPHTAVKPVMTDKAETVDVAAEPEEADGMVDAHSRIPSVKPDAVDGSELPVPGSKRVAVDNAGLSALSEVSEARDGSEVVASYADGKQRSDRVAAIDVSDPIMSRSAETGSSYPAKESEEAEADVPVMEKIANQVVSAGRVVSLRINATIANGTQPVIQIDRLPGNASFDSNRDGSRTFYWQTGDRDQGEHLYRFTAINPNEAYLRDQQEVMIIVGDPSRNKTRPAQPLPSSIE